MDIQILELWMVFDLFLIRHDYRRKESSYQARRYELRNATGCN